MRRKKGVQAIPEEKKEVQLSAEPVTPQGLLEIAVRDGSDVEKIEKLMELQIRWDENEARKAFVRAMTLFRGKCPAINKSEGVNYTTTKGTTDYKYSSLAKTIETIKPTLAECGLSHTWKTDTTGEKISVSCIVTHVQGHSEGTTLTASPDTSGGKNSIQAIGSAVSYLQRYTLFAVLGLSSAEMDDDGQGYEQPIGGNVTAEETNEMENLVYATGSDLGRLLEHAGCETLGEITRPSFNKCMKILKGKTQGDQ